MYRGIPRKESPVRLSQVISFHHDWTLDRSHGRDGQKLCLLVGADGVPEDVDGVGDHGNRTALCVLVTEPVPAITPLVKLTTSGIAICRGAPTVPRQAAKGIAQEHRCKWLVIDGQHARAKGAASGHHNLQRSSQNAHHRAWVLLITSRVPASYTKLVSVMLEGRVLQHFCTLSTARGLMLCGATVFNGLYRQGQ